MRKLIERLTLAFGVSGQEKEIAQLLSDEMAKMALPENDRIGNVKFTFKGLSSKPTVMFIAHMDEIGFVVADILKTGYLKLYPIGGWNPLTLQSSKVVVKTATGNKVIGVIGSIPVHFKGESTALPKIEDFFVDIGATSYDDVIENFKVRIGDQVVPYTDFKFIKQNNRIVSKAFDDRIGVAAMVETAKRIYNDEHPNNVIFVGSVQEEVGARGAKVVANTSKPDVVIVLEGAPADDYPNMKFAPQTAVGKGAHIRLFDPTLIPKKELANYFVHLAEMNNIAYQGAVRRGGGTDGKILHTANMGIPTIVLGVPVRFAHSHNGVISLDDFKALIDLLVAFIKNFDENALNEILK